MATTYDDDTRRRALELHATVGLAEAVRQTGIPKGTIDAWARRANERTFAPERDVDVQTVCNENELDRLEPLQTVCTENDGDVQTSTPQRATVTPAEALRIVTSGRNAREQQTIDQRGGRLPATTMTAPIPGLIPAANGRAFSNGLGRTFDAEAPRVMRALRLLEVRADEEGVDLGALLRALNRAVWLRGDDDLILCACGAPATFAPDSDDGPPTTCPNCAGIGAIRVR